MKQTYLSRRINSWFLLCALLLLFSFSGVKAQELKPVSNTYIIKNATVVQAPGRTLEGAHVLIRDGLISAVGKDLTVPVDAQVVEGDSLVVYAGFIDGLSHAGLEEPKRQERPNVDDPGNPPNEIAGITPYTDVRELLSGTDKSISSLRGVGFTVSHTVPYGNMLPGKGAIILLGDSKEGALIFRENASLYSQFQGARGVYPNTLIGVMAKYRELYTQAKYALNDAARYASQGAGMQRPANDRVLEAFYPVIQGTMPVAFQTEGVKDVHRAITLQEDLGFKLILMGVKQSWDVAENIKSKNLPLFLSLDLPEWKDEPKDSTLTGAEAEEYENLYNRKQDILKKYYSQPAMLNGQSIVFGFTTNGMKTGDFHKNLLKMKEQGATEDVLLAALTTSPASLLGLSKWLGTVDAGKMANLVVTDKNYFEEDAAIRYVFVEGKKYDFEAKPKKSSEKSDEISPLGKWTFSADPGGAPATGTIVFKKENGEFTGVMNYDQGGTSYDLTDVTFDGSTLKFGVIIVDGGQEFSLTGTLDFSSDSYTGTVSSPQIGSFPINGEKIPE